MASTCGSAQVRHFFLLVCPDFSIKHVELVIFKDAVDFTNSEMDQIAIAFLKRAKTHRDCDTTTVIYKVRQHSEPTVFTDFFATWTPVPTENQVRCKLIIQEKKNAKFFMKNILIL